MIMDKKGTEKYPIVLNSCGELRKRRYCVEGGYSL
jgi:hypothetical protein